MALVLGLNAKTAINTGDSTTPVWEIITLIKDETLNMETALSDVTTRAANGWRLQVGTLSDASVDTQLLYDINDADGHFDLILQAFLNKTRLLLGFFDADPTAAGANGLIGGWSVTNFSIGRQLEQAMMVDVTFQVREDDLGAGPSWITTAAP